MTDEKRADLWDLEEAGENLPAESAANPPYSSEKISDLLLQARESIVNVEDSELQVLARISAEFNQAMDASEGRESAELLRDSEIDDLIVDFDEAERASGGAAAETASAPAQRESPERSTVMPRTHPLANSIAPTAAVKSVAPPAEARGPFWQIVAAAAALVALGVGVGQFSPRQDARSERSSESTGAVVHGAASLAPREPVLAPQAAPPARPEEEAAFGAAAEPSTPEATPEPPQVVGSQTEPEGVEEATSRKSAREGRAGRSRRAKRARGQTGPLPAQLSRESVVATMRAAMPELARCTGGRKGAVSAQLTVRGNGKVSYALIEGSFAGTPEGSCLVKALREVRFPAFADSRLRLTYPLQF